MSETTPFVFDTHTHVSSDDHARYPRRSGGYGTAFALLALHMPSLPKPVPWAPGTVTPGGAK